MEKCIGDMNLKECMIYLDDILVFSETFEEHIRRLEAIFRRLRGYGFKLKPSKCALFRNRIKCLGHIVSHEGIETDPAKTDALRNWLVPTNVKQLRSFLWFAGNYRKFVKGYSMIAKPLNKLLEGLRSKETRGRKNNNASLPWTTVEQEAFDLLILKLTSAPVLAYADYSKPFILHTDASGSGLGAVLYQMQEGRERVIAYASRGLSRSERNYPAHKLEFLALKWAICDKFHDHLYGNKFEVITDNNPLTYVLTTAKLDATGHRWLASLASYQFNIKYRPGKNHADADGLSRLPTIFYVVVQDL